LIAIRKADGGCGRDEEGDDGHSSGDPKNSILLVPFEAMGGSNDISQRSIVIVDEIYLIIIINNKLMKIWLVGVDHSLNC
jgi:hypothetical protein